MSETTAPNSKNPPSGWLRLDRAGWWGAFASTPANGVLLAIVPLQIGSFIAQGLDISFWWGLLISVGVAMPVLLVLYLVQRVRYPQPWVNFSSGQLRAGRRVVSLNNITWARLDIFDHRRRHNRMLTLRFGAEGGPRASVRLRGRTGQIPAAAVTEVLAQIVRCSSIAVPQSSNDPTGRFARYNFPGFLSREDALAVVLNPPTIDDPAPVLIA